MPVYEYECGACGHRFEEWQKMSDKPIKTCPKCKAKKVEKLISATSFQLKGGGWYSDLYASKKTGSSSGSDGGGGGETKAESKKDSAPAAKETKAEKPSPASKDKKPGGKKTASA
jgi:putative FmdB family regulatory protein